MIQENRSKIDFGKLLTKTTCFVLIFILILMSVSFLFQHYTEKGYQYRDVQVKQDELDDLKEPKEVLFFGDSIAWAAYSPETFRNMAGITSYNCSTSGQWLGDGVIILREAVTKQKPKIVVWDANSVYTNISRAKYYLSQYVSVFHYHFAYTLQDLIFEEDELGGFNSSDAVNPYSGSSDYMNDMPSQPYTDLAAEKLEDIYDICKENNITLIMTCSPNPHTWNMGRHKAVQEWCDSHGVEFIDYNLLPDEIGIDWDTDTRDGGEHLNNSGSLKVCTHLCRYLKEHYLNGEDGV